MIVASLSDGSTEVLDPTLQDEVFRLAQLVESDRVTALSLLVGGFQSSIPLPKKFRRRSTYGFEVLRDGSGEVIGEKIFVQADDVRLGLSMTYRSKRVRCDLERTGRMLYNPNIRFGGRHDT